MNASHRIVGASVGTPLTDSVDPATGEPVGEFADGGTREAMLPSPPPVTCSNARHGRRTHARARTCNGIVTVMLHEMKILRRDGCFTEKPRTGSAPVYGPSTKD